MTFKFGKRPARKDPRTLKLSAVFRRAKFPAIPSEYIDPAGIPTPMFGNSEYGDCVLAARGHATLRFEHREQDSIVPITDKEVIGEYLNESGGRDEGLIFLDSLKAWRKWGWTAGGRQYKCHAFASVDPCVTEHVQAAICLFGSVQAGFGLPYSVTRDTSNTEQWTIVAGPESAQDSDGGHAVSLVGYGEEGLIGVTWGRRQRIGYNFLEAYSDELWAVIDERDPWLGDNSPIDVPQLEAYLQQLAA